MQLTPGHDYANIEPTGAPRFYNAASNPIGSWDDGDDDDEDGGAPETKIESKMAELVKKIKSRSKLEGELGLLSTTDMLNLGFNAAEHKIEGEDAAKLKEALGQSLYIVNLRSASMRYLDETGMGTKDIRGSPLYRIAMKEFGGSNDGDRLVGYT